MSSRASSELMHLRLKGEASMLCGLPVAEAGDELFNVEGRIGGELRRNGVVMEGVRWCERCREESLRRPSLVLY